MSLSENLINQAEDYLDGKLDADTKKTFELLLKDNQELVNYISINQEMRLQYNEKKWATVEGESELEILETYLKSNEAEEIKSAIKKGNNEFLKKESSSNKKYFSYIAIAASILLLIGYFIFNSPPNNQELYAQYADWSNLPSITTRGNVNSKLLTKGEEAFLNENFVESEKLFEQFLLENGKSDPNTLLYYGISNLELNNNEEALEIFNHLISGNTIDSSKGYWYKALTYLKMDNKDSAIGELKEIVKSSSNYNFDQAKDLLQKLED